MKIIKQAFFTGYLYSSYIACIRGRIMVIEIDIAHIIAVTQEGGLGDDIDNIIAIK